MALQGWCLWQVWRLAQHWPSIATSMTALVLATHLRTMENPIRMIGSVASRRGPADRTPCWPKWGSCRCALRADLAGALLQRDLLPTILRRGGSPRWLAGPRKLSIARPKWQPSLPIADCRPIELPRLAAPRRLPTIHQVGSCRRIARAVVAATDWPAGWAGWAEACRQSAVSAVGRNPTRLHRQTHHRSSKAGSAPCCPLDRLAPGRRPSA